MSANARLSADTARGQPDEFQNRTMFTDADETPGIECRAFCLGDDCDEYEAHKSGQSPFRSSPTQILQVAMNPKSRSSHLTF